MSDDIIAVYPVNAEVGSYVTIHTARASGGRTSFRAVVTEVDQSGYVTGWARDPEDEGPR